MIIMAIFGILSIQLFEFTAVSVEIIVEKLEKKNVLQNDRTKA